MKAKVVYKVFTEAYTAYHGSSLQLRYECNTWHDLNIAISTLKSDGCVGEIKVIKEITEDLYFGYLEDFKA